MSARSIVIFGVLFGIIGLAVGYLVFARSELTNQLIPLGDLFGRAENALGRFVRDVAGLTGKRQSVYISGGVGAAVGVALAMLLGRRR